MTYFNNIKKNTICSFVILFSTLSGNTQTVNWTDIFSNPKATFYEIQKSFEKQEKKWEKQDRKAKRRGLEIGEHSGEEVFKRWAAYMEPRVYPSGNISLPSSNYQNYAAWQKTQTTSAKKTRAGNWIAIGPVGKPTTPAGQGYRTGTGRLNFITIDPTNTQIIYVGTPDGGLWKTTNGGTTWSNSNDFLSSIGSSDLVIDPANTQIMYLATGDREGDRRSMGILKSLDGGTTWSPTSITWTLQDDRKTSRLLMDPTNSLKMILATDAGTYSTTDGWVTNTVGTFPAGSPELKDAELKPNNANIVYASGKKLFKSADFGSTWVEISTGLPSSNISRIALAVSPANANYVYALFGKADSNNFLGFYRSTDAGATFNLQYSGPLNLLGYDLNGLDRGGQAFWDLELEVNPTNADKVITATINQWQTTDGGASWDIKSHWTGDGGKPTVHSDFHCMHYEPGSNSILYSGSDGGLWKSTDDGVTWNDISNNLNISQVNKMGVSQTNASLYIAGMQDNGTNFKSGATWGNIFGGDGGESFIDRTNDNTLYYCYVESEVHRSDDGGVTDMQVTTGLPNGNGIAEFYSSFHQDPVVATRLYAGGHVEMYRSNDKGDNWTMIGTPLGAGRIKEFAIAPTNNQIIYALKSNEVSKSTDGGATWNDADVLGNLPTSTSAPTMVAISNTDAQKVWIVFSGYSAGDKVFRTINGGSTWTNISTGLPNLPINTIVYKNGSATDEIYIGADIGVYYMNNSTSWVSYFTNLPNVSVRDLEIQYTTQKIIAATYGRGIWESALFASNPLPVKITSFTGATINEINQLNWSAAQEINLINYDIQKSHDGINFKTIGTVKAAATTEQASYNYNDANPYSGNNYYRLQANDIDTKTNFSEIINLFITKEEPSIYPNPASDNITFELQNATFSIQLIDINGKVVYSKKDVTNKIEINTHQLSNGIYTLEIETKNETKQSQKINIIH